MSTSSSAPQTFTELINRWEILADFARETKQPYERVKRWRALSSIKPKYWPAVKAACWARGYTWADDSLFAKLALQAEQSRADRVA